MKALGTDFTIACPAFPEAGRTICRGYLFVGDVLLSESGMKDHPLTPMTDANLVRVLQAQTQRKVGLIRYDTLAQGAAAVRATHRGSEEGGRRHRRRRRAVRGRPRPASPRAAPSCRW